MNVSTIMISISSQIAFLALYLIVFFFSLREGEEWHKARYGVQTTLMKPKSALPFLPGQSSVAEDFVKRMKSKLDAKNEIEGFQQELFRYGLEGRLVTLKTFLIAYC